MITHNYPRFDGDYAGVFLSLLAKQLPHYDIEPIILAPHAAGLKEFEILDGVKIHRFRYMNDEKDENIAYQGNMHKLVLGSVNGIFQFKQFLNSYRQSALDIIQKEQIDIIAGHWLVPAGLVMKPLYKKTGLPMIMSSHGTDIRLMKKYFNVLYRFLKTFCLQLKSWTVVSSFLRDGILSMDRRLEPILEVLPMPHDETVFYRDESVIRDNNLIVSVPRFTDQKRVDILIKAFALISEKNADLKLHIYGEGPLRSQIDDLIDKFALQNRVAIFNPVTQHELREIYNRASIVVLNSVNEGFGLTLSEAMLCGATVIGTDSGGIRDIIEHEKRGLLVPINNSEKLAEAILRLIDNPDLCQKLGMNGYAFANEQYQSEPLARRYSEIIKNILRY